MLNFEYYFSLYIFIFSLMLVCLYYKHLMCLIISLEMMVIMIVYNMFLIMIMIESSFYMILFLLVIFVCEGVLSLSLIILLIRFWGNDYINSLSMMKW